MRLAKRVAAALCLLAGTMWFCGCGTQAASSSFISTSAASVSLTVPREAPPTASGRDEPQKHYQAPEALYSDYSEEEAETCGVASWSLAHLSEGYIPVKSLSQKSVVILVTKGEDTYKYWLPKDGTPTALPINMGSGSYSLRVMENISGDNYAQSGGTTVDVELKDEFTAFLRPCQLVEYSPEDECVKLAAGFAAESEDAIDLVGKVYDYMVENIVYDEDKAANAQPGYLPNPDETLRSGKGICFDYGSLAAAMLRSQGVPTKLITGYVKPKGLYHAWNRIYIEGQGWITAHIQASGKNWQRVDITFAAGGTDEQYLTDDSNYTDRLMY